MLFKLSEDVLNLCTKVLANMGNASDECLDIVQRYKIVTIWSLDVYTEFHEWDKICKLTPFHTVYILHLI